MRNQQVLRELQDHLPFSIFFTAAGVVLAALLTYQDLAAGMISTGAHDHGDEHGHVEAKLDDGHDAEHEAEPAAEASAKSRAQLERASRMLFHIMHPVHLLLSAMATTAMFWRYDKKLWKAILTGFVGAVGVCGLSDIFMPYLCGRWFESSHMHFHWCLFEHPRLVLPFVGLGILSGLMAAGAIARSTMFSHSAHVLVSCTASLFYLISFGVPDWFSEDKLPVTFAIVILCVTIPCCLSDILFPLLVASGDEHEHYHHQGHGDDGDHGDHGPHCGHAH